MKQFYLWVFSMMFIAAFGTWVYLISQEKQMFEFIFIAVAFMFIAVIGRIVATNQSE